MENFFKVECFSKVGKRENNEDAIFPNPEEEYSQGNIENLFLVCDGMGGYQKGEFASDMICSQMSKYFIDHNIEQSDKETIKNGLKFVESKFDSFIVNSEESAGMGSTMTLLHLHKKGVTTAHVGDSRIYQIRNGKIIFQTKDHSLVQQLLDSGALETEEEARNHPEKNVILRAVRGASVQAAKPEINFITDLHADDIFFMCSDGVVESFTDVQLEDVFASMPTLEAMSAKIIQKCNKDSSDNYSAYFIQLKPEYIATLEIEKPIVKEVEKSKNVISPSKTQIIATENSEKIVVESEKIVGETAKVKIPISKTETQIFAHSTSEKPFEENRETEADKSIVEKATTPNSDTKTQILSKQSVENEETKVAANNPEFEEKATVSQIDNQVVSARAAQQEETANPIYEDIPGKSKNNLIYFIAGFLFLLIAGSLYFFVFNKDKKEKVDETTSEIVANRDKYSNEINNKSGNVKSTSNDSELINSANNFRQSDVDVQPTTDNVPTALESQKINPKIALLTISLSKKDLKNSKKLFEQLKNIELSESDNEKLKDLLKDYVALQKKTQVTATVSSKSTIERGKTVEKKQQSNNQMGINSAAKPPKKEGEKAEEQKNGTNTTGEGPTQPSNP